MLFKAFLRTLMAFSRSSFVTLLVRRTGVGLFGLSLDAEGESQACSTEGAQLYVSERALTIRFDALVLGFGGLIGNGGILVFQLTFEGAPVVSASAALGNGAVHTVAGL